MYHYIKKLDNTRLYTSLDNTQVLNLGMAGLVVHCAGMVFTLSLLTLWSSRILRTCVRTSFVFIAGNSTEVQLLES